MKIVVATGIYPPDIGGPATYVKALAQELIDLKHEVIVITYSHIADQTDPWLVVGISKSGGSLFRWWRYSRALKKYGEDADIVYAFSSVSCGIPLKMAGLQKPKKILRLGGDFLWERYTDRGGKLGLREWYGKICNLRLMTCDWLLQHFDHIVFSSAFQRDIYLDHYNNLPAYSVIENALAGAATILHEKHNPFRILFLGRLVRFKNLPPLFEALKNLPHTTLTIAGSGPKLSSLQALAKTLNIADRIAFVGNREGKDKQKLFYDHDLLVLPSLTEISPNVALEARAVGMPVLLTEETGLSLVLQKGMVVRALKDAGQILVALKEVQKNYGEIAAASAQPNAVRSWCIVAQEHENLFKRLVP
ncbi:MAG: glucosyltransferase [Candidatus Peregrinibacteria bacterium Greene0416_62]|nr:MAG: glucosyltransferase [Candidatus Peregrinibacteria bacterium Greene0416_62]TSC98907.1 MAG: glucosyltransferase [Candidatus Peregrinibacteria bacterium Greene1014_49]